MFKFTQQKPKRCPPVRRRRRLAPLNWRPADEADRRLWRRWLRLGLDATPSILSGWQRQWTRVHRRAVWADLRLAEDMADRGGYLRPWGGAEVRAWVDSLGLAGGHLHWEMKEEMATAGDRHLRGWLDRHPTARLGNLAPPNV